MTSPDWELLWRGPGTDFLLPFLPQIPSNPWSGLALALPLKTSRSIGVTDADRGTDSQNHQGCNHGKAKEAQKWRGSTQKKLSGKDGTELRTRWRKKSMKRKKLSKELES